MPVSTAEYLAGMRRLAAGVTIVTTRHQGVPAGLTATSVCSLTAEPPRLVACINRDTDTHALIRASGIFAVNLLTQAHRDLADHFGGRTDAFGPARFALAAWTTAVTGAPLLLDAAASFDCRLVQAISAGTHSIFIGEVEAVLARDEAEELVYHDRGYAALARGDG
ncbi:flavin reductase family protein [Benzoatithermus flavus]|uniref:Flavin reductase family protein n=1 Tax=Benzoatithermus flavus TaxID=3108223 RepID=A0ABU8XWR4_9PROT